MKKKRETIIYCCDWWWSNIRHKNNAVTKRYILERNAHVGQCHTGSVELSD